MKTKMKDEGKRTAAQQKCRILQKGHDVTEFQMIVAASLRFQALDEHLAHFTSKNQ